MRRDEHITGLRPCRHEPREGVPLEIAGEEQATAGRFDRKHDAPLVVGHGGVEPSMPGAGCLPVVWVGVRIVAIRMQNADAAVRIDGEFVSGPDRAQRDALVDDPLQEIGDRRRPALQKVGRDHDLAHGEPLEELRHGVEVVCVGMGDDERVDPPYALAPQHPRQRPAGGGRRPQPAGVIEQASARRAADHDARAMSDRSHHHPERPRPGVHEPTEPAHHKADDDPGHPHAPPGAGPGQTSLWQHEAHRREQHVPADDPPPRRRRQPRMAAGHGRRPGHEPADAGERDVAGGAARAGDGGGERRRRQAGRSPAHRQGHERGDEHVEHQSDRAEHVEPGRYEGR